MSDFLYRAGTVLAPTGSKKHLYIICNDPVFDPIRNDNCVLVVNISSVSEDRDYDDTCILQKGDHPFIKHDSYVYYKGATVLKEKLALLAIEREEMVPYGKISDEVFQRVMKGLLNNDDLPFKAEKFLSEYILSDIE